MTAAQFRIQAQRILSERSNRKVLRTFFKHLDNGGTVAEFHEDDVLAEFMKHSGTSLDFLALEYLRSKQDGSSIEESGEAESSGNLGPA